MDDRIANKTRWNKLTVSGLTADWLWSLVLLLLVILSYQPLWYAGFVWDDDSHLTANPCIVGPLGLKEIWTTAQAQFYPLVLTTFWVEHACWGLDPRPYHFVNILLHGCCAIVFWRVLCKLQVPGAWLGAALWALHPIQVESVAWISEMTNTQSCLFYLISIFFFLRGLGAGWKGDWNYRFMLLFAALAILSKSSTVILPLVLCLCAWWTRDRCGLTMVLKLVPVFALSVIGAALAIETVTMQRVNDDPQWVQTWPQRVVVAGRVVWFYLDKLLWPYPLIAKYPRWEIDAGSAIAYLPSLAVLLLLALLWLKRATWARSCFFAFACFVATLLPVLGLVNHHFMRYSFVADHLQYLAGMGPLALAGAGLAWLANRFVPGKIGLQFLLGTALLLVFGAVTWERSWVYENDDKLWTDAVAKNSDCWIGYYNLGLSQAQKGHTEEAIEDFKKALLARPAYPEGHYNIALALIIEGHLDEATDHLLKTIALDPVHAHAYNNLANIMVQKGRLDEGIHDYRKSLEIAPDNAVAHLNLGLALRQKGDLDEAITEFQEAVSLQPGFYEATDCLARAREERSRHPGN